MSAYCDTKPNGHDKCPKCQQCSCIVSDIIEAELNITNIANELMITFERYHKDEDDIDYISTGAIYMDANFKVCSTCFVIQASKLSISTNTLECWLRRRALLPGDCTKQYKLSLGLWEKQIRQILESRKATKRQKKREKTARRQANQQAKFQLPPFPNTPVLDTVD